MRTKRNYFVPNYEKLYEMSEYAKTMDRHEFGMKELESIIKQTRRGLITKADYNRYRKEIEKQLLRI